MTELCASRCFGFGVIESNVSKEARGEGGREWMSQVLHPCVLTNQAVLWILAFQETITHPSSSICIWDESSPVFPAALFEQNQTLGKGQLYLLIIRYRGCWAVHWTERNRDVTSCCNVVPGRLLRFGMIWRISERNIFWWGNVQFVLRRSYPASLISLYRNARLSSVLKMHGGL